MFMSQNALKRGFALIVALVMVLGTFALDISQVHAAYQGNSLTYSYEFDGVDEAFVDFDELGYIGFTPFVLGDISVFLNLNGGTMDAGTPNARTGTFHWHNANPGERLTDPSSRVTRANHTLTGWNRTVPTPATPWNFDTVLPPLSTLTTTQADGTRQFTLTAVWTPIPVDTVRQYVDFTRRWLNSEGQPASDTVRRTAIQGGANALITPNPSPINTSGNWHGATGGAAFVAWYTDQTFTTRIVNRPFLAGVVTPRQYTVFARYRRTLNFNWAGSTASRHIYINYPGITAGLPTTGLYEAPVVGNTMRNIQILSQCNTYTMTFSAPHQFSAWGLTQQPANPQSFIPGWYRPPVAANDVSAQVRDGSVTGFNFLANGTLAIHAWYRLATPQTHQVTLMYNHYPNQGLVRVFNVPHEARLPHVPSPPAGAHFVAWYRVNPDNSIGERWNPNTTITEDIRLVARYEFRVQFNLNHGTINGSGLPPAMRIVPINIPSPAPLVGTMTYGQVLADIPDPVGPNWYFHGWFKHTGNTMTPVVPGDLISYSQTLTAMFCWSPPHIGGPVPPPPIVTITYVMPHATPDRLTQYVFYGRPFPDVSGNPTRVGFTLNYWLTSDTNEKVVFGQTLARNMTITAQRLIDYPVEFRVNNVVHHFLRVTETSTSLRNPVNRYITPDCIAGVTPHQIDPPLSDIATFSHWQIRGRHTNPSPTNGTILGTWDGVSDLPVNRSTLGTLSDTALVAVANQPVTFHAVWTPNPRVTLVQEHINSRVRHYSRGTRLSNGEFEFRFDPATVPTPQRRAHTFSGWYTCNGRDSYGLPCVSCEGVRWTSDMLITEDMYLFARWGGSGSPYVVTFVIDHNGNRTIAEVPANFGDFPVPPDMYHNDTRIFASGWYSNSALTVPIDLSVSPVQGNKRVYGRFTTDRLIPVTLLSPFGGVYGVVYVEAGSSLTRAALTETRLNFPATYIFQNNWFHGRLVNIPEQDIWQNPGIYYGENNMLWVFDGYGLPGVDTVNSPITLLASVGHTVSFDMQEAGGATQMLVLRGNLIHNIPTPQLDGHRFMGWSTQRTYGGRMWNPTEDRVWGHLNLFAIWEPINDYIIRIVVDMPQIGGTRVIGDVSECGEEIVFVVPRNFNTGRIEGQIYRIYADYCHLEFQVGPHWWVRTQHDVLNVSGQAPANRQLAPAGFVGCPYHHVGIHNGDIIRLAGSLGTSGEGNRLYRIRIIESDDIPEEQTILALSINVDDVDYAGDIVQVVGGTITFTVPEEKVIDGSFTGTINLLQTSGYQAAEFYHNGNWRTAYRTQDTVTFADGDRVRVAGADSDFNRVYTLRIVKIPRIIPAVEIEELQLRVDGSYYQGIIARGESGNTITFTLPAGKLDSVAYIATLRTSGYQAIELSSGAAWQLLRAGGTATFATNNTVRVAGDAGTSGENNAIYTIVIVTETPGRFGETMAPFSFIPSGTYPVGVAITLFTFTPNAEIRFTLDGSEPTQSSRLFQYPFDPGVGNVRLRARAFAPNMYPSEIVEYEFFMVSPLSIELDQEDDDDYEDEYYDEQDTPDADYDYDYDVIKEDSEDDEQDYDVIEDDSEDDEQDYDVIKDESEDDEQDYDVIEDESDDDVSTDDESVEDEFIKGDQDYDVVEDESVEDETINDDHDYDVVEDESVEDGVVEDDQDYDVVEDEVIEDDNTPTDDESVEDEAMNGNQDYDVIEDDSVEDEVDEDPTAYVPVEDESATDSDDNATPNDIYA